MANIVNEITHIATPQEIAINRHLALNATHHQSWIWSEQVVSYIPPVAWPTDGCPYLWDESAYLADPENGWSRFPNFPFNVTGSDIT